MRRRTDRTRGMRGRVAAIGIGALLAGASVVPATAAQAASTTTVHGTVQAGSTKLAGIPVGFWSRTGHRLAGTTSGAGGAFTLHVPSGVRGFAYAGARPDATKAIFSAGGTSFVRGVIGASQGRTTSYRIYQGHTSATAAHLAGGMALRFRLQKPGRVVVHGGKYFAGPGDDVGIAQVQRLNGRYVSEAPGGTSGTATSSLLVPGKYRLWLIPLSPYLRRTVAVTVTAAGTAQFTPTFTKGATLSGTVQAKDGVPAAGVPVAAVKTGSGGGATTDSKGHFTIRGLAAGTYSLKVGYNAQPDPEDLPDDPDTIPPVTSDDWVARTVRVTVDSHHDPVHTTVTLTPAGQVTATVTGATDSARAWLETTDGTIVRTHGISDGKVELGGLVPGTAYRLYVATGSNGGADGRYGEVDLTAVAGPQTTSVALTRTTITLKGHVSNAPGGTVQVRSQGATLPALARSDQRIASSGAYAVHGLIPSRYTVTVFDAAVKRVPSRPRVLTLAASPAVVAKDYAAGPRAGAYTVRFVSGSAPVHNALGEAVNSAGDVATVLSEGTTGKAIADSLWPGTYRYQPKSFLDGGNYDVPAVDGPWWFGGISSSFVIRAGATTNDGTIALHVHASL